MNRLSQHPLLPLLAAALAVGLRFWPVLLGREAFLQWDALFSGLAVDHLQSAILQEADWRALGLGWPASPSIPNVDWMFVQAVLGLPLRALGMDPALAYSLVTLLELVATGAAVGWAYRLLVGPGWAVAAAAALGALSPWAIQHAQHSNLVSHLGLVLACVGVYAAGQRRGSGALALLGLLLAFHSGVYLGVQAAVMVVVVALLVLVLERRPRPLLTGALSLGLTALSAAPVLRVYREFALRFGVQRGEEELLTGSWDLALAWRPTATAPLHAPLLAFSEPAALTGAGNMGYLASALALFALFGVLRDGEVRRRWAPALLLTGVAGLLALGPELQIAGTQTGIPGPYALLAALPGVEALREPSRWASLAFLGGALLAAEGLRRLASSRARLLLPLLLLGVVMELPRPALGRLDGLRPHAVYRLLDQLPQDGAVLDAGLGPKRSCACDAAQALRAAQFHGRPLLGGRYARVVELLSQLQTALVAWPKNGTPALALASGVTVVVEHPPLAPAPPGWTCQEEQDHRLCSAPPQAERSWSIEPEGAVAGLRVPRSALSSTLSFQCGDAEVQTLPTGGWVALADLRDPGGDMVDMFLDVPCVGALRASPRRWLALYAAEGRSPWLATLPAQPRSMADLFVWTDLKRPEGPGPSEPPPPPKDRPGL